MKRTRLTELLLTGGVLTATLVASAVASFGQTSENVQLAANYTTAAPAKAGADLAPTPLALQARIEAQQREIDELRALVVKLESKLERGSEPLASAQPMLPPENTASIAALPALAGPAPAPAPEPAPAPLEQHPYRAPRELLPDIGQIGAQVGLFVGGATNPYKDNQGFASGGYIDLPWKSIGSGKLSYEIMLGLQTASTTQQSTSGVNVLANAVVNSYLGNTSKNSTTLTSYLAGPLPITSSVDEHSRVLTVAPVLLKYALTNMGRFRPYVVGGLGFYVWIGNQNNSKSFDANSALGSLASAPVGSSTLGATLNSLLQGSQIGGLAPASPELAARGVPQGQGNLMFGGQIGGGFEFRVSPKLTMGVDVRRNQVEGTNSSFTTFAFKQGLNW